MKNCENRTLVTSKTLCPHSTAEPRDTDAKAERGFTLIELLIVVTILPLVVGAIAVGLLSVFSLQSSATNRISGSGNAQVISSYFVKDVQSATDITTLSTSTPQCGPSTAGIVTQLFGLQLGSSETVVSYDSVANGTTYSLVRNYCTGGSMSSPVSSTTLSADLQPASTLLATCPSSATSCSVLSPFDWQISATIAALKFTVMQLRSKYSFTLYASPRSTSDYVPTGGAPFAPFALLGTSTDCSGSTPVLSVGNGTLSINVAPGFGNGILGINSTCPNSVTVANNGQILASTVATANTGLNSIQTNTHATYPGTEFLNTYPLDPFVAPSPEALTPPTPPPVATIGTCTLAGSTYTCSPGNYAATQTFNNNTTIQFSGPTGSTYSFANGLSIPNGATVNLAPGGTYILNGPTALTTGTSGISINGSGVLLYIGGTVPANSALFSNNASINLTAGSGYYGVAIWDASVGGTLTLGNNASSVNSYGGIYVPYGTVVDNNNGTIATSFIVANSAMFKNGLSVTITSP